MEFRDAIQKLLNQEDLGDSAHDAAKAIFDRTWSELEVASFLTAMQAKGASGSEIAAFASELRFRCIPVLPTSHGLVDTCGTGGGLPTFNISTAAAFVVAGTGVPVAKHGNRAITSKCGSADVLEALGAKLSPNTAELARLIDEVGIAFLFAPNHHPAMGAVGPIRKQLGFRTIFNQLGPLANPAGVRKQVIGVYSESLLDPMVEALLELGVERALVVHGEGLDEVAPFGETQARVIENGEIRSVTFEPSSWKTEDVDRTQIIGEWTAEESAETVRTALSEVDSIWAKAILPSASAGIWVSGRVDTFEEAGAIAKESISSGSALAKLDQFVRETNRS